MLMFEAKNVIYPSTLVKFYLKYGAIVTIEFAIAYTPAPALRRFITQQTALRIEADNQGHPEKALLAKTVMNSSFGRNCMNYEKRSKQIYSNGLQDTQLLNNRYLKYVEPILSEGSSVATWEYTLRQKNYTDVVPVSLGSWILSASKLHVLKVIEK